MAEDLSRKIYEALAGLAGEAPLREGAKGLLNTLGYESARTAEAGSVEEFLDRFRPERPLTDKQRRLFDDWRKVEIVFQVTDEEIKLPPDQRGLFDGPGFDRGRTKSFLFLAVDMQSDSYRRADLAEATRAVNRLFRMPVIVLFRHGSAATLAAVHRRASRRNDDWDVLEKVTLVKDIRLDDPHRAHIEILADLSLEDMIQAGVRSFDDLHERWEQTLDIETLNKRFYRKLFRWFERAVEECRFPDDGAGEDSDQRHVIRLITRLLFIWFLKEKGLVPEDLFEERFARERLKDYEPKSTGYYRAVLQNLFFATLNTEIDRRAFSKKNNATHRDFNKYRYRKLLRDPEAFVEKLKQVPFVNGGLFDCLDDFAAASEGGQRIDAFTDNIETQGRDLHVPAQLLLDEEDSLFALFRHYKFTIEENTPLDAEVALDPELLGRVFENLLAAYNPETRETARKATGSYYTPRQVVDYMVREALIEALAVNARPTVTREEHWRDQLGYLLDWEDGNADAGEFFDAEEARSVVEAIAGLRTLDPAVGSGAFPMGILQTLTMALRRLDPDNEFWEAFQKERAAARARQAFDTEDRRRRDDELAEISATFEKYRRSDFGRKLYLIQNGIYGVDIQPIACQIAKLRFFISLAIEQKPDPDEPNLGIKPLPNLETRFVAADTLIGLQNEADPFLLDDRVVSKRSEIAAVRERYFLADSRPKKLECIKTEQRLRGELRTILEAERQEWLAAQKRDIEDRAKGVPNLDAREKFRDQELLKLADRRSKFDETLADAHKVAEWEPFDQNLSADWFESQYMFGVQDGFDIVIGNPPYVESRSNLISKSAKDRYGKQVMGDWNDSVPRGSDLYIYFFARSIRLIKGSGLGCFITQNAWLNTDYGLAFQRFSKDRFSFNRVVDTSARFFSGQDGPNINAIVSFFSWAIRENIEHAIVDRNMSTVSKKVFKLGTNIKWGHLFSMPEFFEQALQTVSAKEEKDLAAGIYFGQGINIPKRKLVDSGETVSVIVREPRFSVDHPDKLLSAAELTDSRLARPPALIMPRGVGERHYCAFNSMRAMSLSAVELYLPNRLWNSDEHYCLWAYLNSSFVWLFREITGRRNLGGGMLKAEATDMRGLPVGFAFGFGAEARGIFENIRRRKPLPIYQELYTDEHQRIDGVVMEYFGLLDVAEDIREALVRCVEQRVARARAG